MKFLNIILSLAIFATTTVPANVQAITITEYKMEVSTEKRIANAFNKFRYDMTVEWNQQDVYFKEYAQTQLENSLLALRAEGVTVEEIQAYMEKSILDAKTKNDYRRLVDSIKKQNLSEDEASEVAMKFMEKSYAQGASFSSGSSVNYKKIAIIVGVVVIGVVTFLIIRNCKKNNGSTSSTSAATDSSSTSATTSSETSAETSSETSSSVSDASTSTTGADNTSDNSSSESSTSFTSSSSSSSSSSTGGDCGDGEGDDGENDNGNNGWEDEDRDIR